MNSLYVSRVSSGDCTDPESRK